MVTQEREQEEKQRDQSLTTAVIETLIDSSNKVSY